MPAVLITGANRGIGLELARQYIGRGWAVIAVSRGSSDPLEALSESGQLQSHRLDLTDDTALKALAESLQGQTIDVLVNNAGTMGWQNFAELGINAGRFGTFNREEWHQILDINLCTPMRLIELLIENLAASNNGRIVNISSVVSSMALNRVGGMYAYRASKAAINSITQSLAVDLASRNIIVVALHPGFVRTDMSGPVASIDPDESAAGVIKVIDELAPEMSGRLVAWNGDLMPW
jgi:NAD(P)-dependent dehydrogenase (short-subunit alcohol dehydrogenase family)